VSRPSPRLAILVVLLGVAAVTGWWSLQRLAELRRAEAVCGAVERADWTAALAVELDLERPGAPALRAAECRALALMQAGRREETMALGEELLAGAAPADWLPSAGFVAVLAEGRRDRGELPRAAELARRGALRYPQSVLLAYLEMDLRSRLEDEATVLEEMIHRLPLAGVAAPRLRLRIAERLLAREAWDEAVQLLGERPPAQEDLLPQWARLRARGLAGMGRSGPLLETLDSWRRAGGNGDEIDAFYAILCSMYSIQDPRHTVLELLAESAAKADSLGSESLRRAVYRRYIPTLAVHGRYDEAVALLERVEPELGELPGLSREDLLRARDGHLRPPDEFAEVRAAVTLTLADVRPGDRVWLSPAPRERVDLDGTERRVAADGRLEIERGIGVAPLRWVARDADGATIGSGAVWPVEDRPVEARIERRAAPPAAPRFGPEAAGGDGRRRVFGILLDSGDWRLVQYLRARGDLPVLDALIARGLRGVLHSDPPFTAVAVNSIARPGERGVRSFFGMLLQLGTEVETINFVGRNPFGAARWLVPDTQGLFDTLGAGDLAVVGMLRSFGPVRAGRQGEMIGPFGRVRRIAGYRGARELSAEELAAFAPLTTGSSADDHLIQEMAADFDTAVAVAEEGVADLFLLRVDSLDVLTHAHFAATAESGQDDGDLFLYWVYRYLDRRLGELARSLDDDDLLIVFSDHGSRTALEHDTRSLFIACGAGVRPGRLAGKPELRGISRMLAELLGVSTDWPETELSDWARELG
jgi:hypothetical protein